MTTWYEVGRGADLAQPDRCVRTRPVQAQWCEDCREAHVWCDGCGSLSYRHVLESGTVPPLDRGDWR